MICDRAAQSTSREAVGTGGDAKAFRDMVGRTPWMAAADATVE
jgi:hypothetical protein